MAGLNAGHEVPYPDPTFDLNSLLPSDKSYIGYVGSLVRIHA
jgi:carbonic anhydrase